MKKPCQHLNDIKPDKLRRVWVCQDCGEVTRNFLTAEERQAISEDEARWSSGKGIVRVSQ